MARFRFLIVGALALVVLSTPFITEAKTKKVSTVQVTEVSNTIAGLSTEFTVQGDTYSYVEALLSNPNGKELVMEAVTDGRGMADFAVSDFHVQKAGDYQVQARHLGTNEGYSSAEFFEVYPGTFSTSESTAEFKKHTAQVGETLEMTAKVQDQYGNALKGHVLKASPNRNTVQVYSPEFATNEDGEMNFYVIGEAAGIVELTIFDTSSNQNFAEQPKLAFLTSESSPYLNTGGFDDEFVTLSAESGPLDSFRITTDPVQEVGENFSVTITAIDADGITVTDYTGTVRFSSTDASATLPNDYSFLAEDLGEHSFSLAVKFVTPGEQMLSLNDIDQFSVTGEATIEVSTEDISVDLGDDFVTDDFARDGDFTLISPASGTYSADTIEIQGEADYGYYAITYLNNIEAERTEIEFENTFQATLTDVLDGDYELYVDIVELDATEPEVDDAEILLVIESSDMEMLTIDTTAPEIVSISAAPVGELQGGELITVTVLTESTLQEANLLFESQLTPLLETTTAGKYEAEIVMPEEVGSFTLDVILMDQLGNEVQYRDQLIFNVGAIVEPEPEVPELLAVTGLSATAGEESIILSWEAAEGEAIVDHYRISYGPAANALFAITDSFDASTSWTVPNLTGGQAFYFAVAPVDAEGNTGPQTDAIVGTPLAKAGAAEPEMFRPDLETDPAISETELPPAQPETGPELLLLLLMSFLGSGGYVLARQKV